MNEGVAVYTVFGIPLTEEQFQTLVMEFRPDLFVNVGTGKDWADDPWEVEFKNITEEKREIIRLYFDGSIPNIEYGLMDFHYKDKWQGAFLTLDSHEHIVSCIHVDNPKNMHIPTETDIQNFLDFARPILTKHNINLKYQATTVAETC